MIALVGQSVLDRVTWPDGRVEERLGGAPIFAAQAIGSSWPAVVVTRGATPELRRPLHGFGLEVVEGPGEHTLVSEMELHSDGSVSERVSAFGDPFTIGDVRGWMAPALARCSSIVCGAQARDEFPPATLAALALGGRVFLDGQGPARAERLGPLRLEGPLRAEMVPGVAVLKLSEEEAAALIGGIDPAAAAAIGVPVVVVTLGPRGAVVLAVGRARKVRVEPVSGVIDTIGAGDAFLALMAAATEAGADPVAAAQTACDGVSRLLRARRDADRRARRSDRLRPLVRGRARSARAAPDRPRSGAVQVGHGSVRPVSLRLATALTALGAELTRRSRIVAVVAVALAGVGALSWWALDRGTRTALPDGAVPVFAHVRTRPSPGIVERPTGRLAQPVQDAAAVALDAARAMLLGGLTAADTSTGAIRIAAAGADRAAGRLPGGLHDSAAVRLGRAVYLFGGGNGSRQLDAILRVPAGGGTARLAGHLPAPSSDQAAAAIAGTAYVVGGYTGRRWLDTIVAWRPGAPARVVAHLPSPLRYAAVAADGNRLVIAGGSLPDGSASDAVLEYVPAAGRVFRLGRLSAPTTHAAAATLGAVVYVIGGRAAAAGSLTDRIVGVDLGSGRIRLAGRLSTPLSDLAAVTLGSRILLAGGRSSRGTEAQLSELAVAPRAAAIAALARTGNVYAADGPNMLTGPARSALPRIYVPNSASNTVDVIDPRTYRIVEHFAVGSLPQHVVPAYDLATLYVTNDQGGSLTPIDPMTGKPGTPIRVDDPYNMYFTPDGRFAIVVAERLHRLDFRDAHTFRLHHSLHVPCAGLDHIDFSAGGGYLIASCEFSGQMLKVDVQRERVDGALRLPDGRRGMPQDVKLSPDGKVFYVADMMAGGLWELDGDRLKVTGFLPTGRGVHGLYPSRDARLLYATNRGEGSVSVISFRTRKVLLKWWIPGGGSPDMGGVSADGKVLWLSGRYNAEVYAISTTTGKLLARIRVGRGPHGLSVWPQPGRYSLGHTGILR